MKEDMEQKELNLCEILKGHEGDVFYSPCYGNVKLTDVYVENIVVRSIIGEKKHTLTDKGTHPNGGEPMLFPSKELRESYTFEGAWQKWAEDNKKMTYEDVCNELFINDKQNEDCRVVWCSTNKGATITFIPEKHLERLLAINKLMNVQKWIEKGWQPDWKDKDMAKWYIFIEGDKLLADETNWQCGDIYFSSKENAEQAIDILGEDVIRQVLSTDW